jgi:hypothetical protein
VGSTGEVQKQKRFSERKLIPYLEPQRERERESAEFDWFV